MGQLFEALVPELEARFSAHGLTIEAGPPRRAVVPAVHPDVGDLLIYDDDQELTVGYGHFTHCHYGPFQYSPDVPVADTLQSLLSDLDALFGNQLILWGSHAGGGGIFRMGEEAGSLWDASERRYVWSGPV